MKTEEKKIDGFRYMMRQLGGETGRAVALRLMRPLGAAVSAAVALAGQGAVSLEKVIGYGAGAALEKLSEPDLVFVSERFAEQTTVWIPDAAGRLFEQPLPTVFDDHFAGRYDAMFEWLRWGIVFNRFFAGALERLAAQRAAAEAEKRATSKSPTASTDGSGASSAPADG